MNGRFVLRQYNKASKFRKPTYSGFDFYFDEIETKFILLLVKHLKKYQTLNSHNTTVLLTTCVLFICLEFMRGNLRQALKHIASGNLILKQKVSSNSSLNPIEAQLIEIFSRLSIQAAVNGFKIPLLQPNSMVTTPISSMGIELFSTLEAARNALNNIMALCLRFIDAAMTSFNQQSKSDTFGRLKDTQTNLLTRLELWKKNFEECQFSDPFLDPSIGTLMVLHLHATIWSTAALYTDECAWDAQFSRFAKIVSLCRSITKSSSDAVHRGPYSIVGLPRASPKRPTWRHAFTFEMGIIPSLYFTVLKCRDPKLRREAIQLLGLARPRKEGLWDAGALQTIAQRVIEMEEDKMLEGELPAEHKRTVTRNPRFTLYSATGEDTFGGVRNAQHSWD